MKGSNPKDKYGTKKPSLALVPPVSTLHEAAAFMDGAAKYGEYNWRSKQVSLMVYLNAAQRHLAQYLDGEDFDQASGVHHLGHAKACLGIVLDAVAGGNALDDRPLKGKASECITAFSKSGTLQYVEEEARLRAILVRADLRERYVKFYENYSRCLKCGKRTNYIKKNKKITGVVTPQHETDCPLHEEGPQS